ncbi:NAD(P)/FAD-dependent oxidoreductase [Sporobolomyces koalae]|uniref:NAD(P)/FAD-dependent oxidoreductase n=1 Tax=Sporobolomyces koalae TaxID=500713 RepID=UPI003181C199
MAQHQDIVIVGAGIVGLCTAYYSLALSDLTRVTLVEASTEGSVAGGASSYAGGFVAGGSSWHNEPSQDLARASFKCHVELAKVLDGARQYGWRECGAIGLSLGHPVNRSAYRSLPGGKGKETLEVEKGRLPPGEWVEGEKEELSLEGGVGQVDPAEFCQTLFTHLRRTYGERFTCKFGQVTQISRGTPDKPTIAFSPHETQSREHLPFDKLVISAGPWSAQVCDLLELPAIPITNLPGHSLLIRPALDAFQPVDSKDSKKELPSGAVFAGIDGGIAGVHGEAFGLARGLTEEEKARGYTRAPEFFVRKNGLVYVAGENSIPASAHESSVGLPNKLPQYVNEVKNMVDADCAGRLKRAAGAVSPFLKEENGAVIERTQFCYRPISSDREPIVGFLERDVLVATGHGPWGITLAPGTGQVIAEMALGLPLSAEVSGLSPARFGIKF